MFILSYICKSVWLTSEYFGLPLGRMAPFVFGGMIGAWPRPVKVCEMCNGRGFTWHSEYGKVICADCED